MESVQSVHDGAIAVEGPIKEKALIKCHGLAGSDPQDVGIPSEHWNVPALIYYNTFTLLSMYGNVCNETNKLKIHSFGMEIVHKTFSSVCNNDYKLLINGLDVMDTYKDNIFE